ncbi:hypothetical protein ACMU_00680 [Actibacterium mucosum KCTC 23349]|uniref:AB hydrolase-1 domain-containing protein n=1 Tax=Actibacterium mucosum KCTC 23349 TaxID=1454373 RepID=A0A037ZLR5_9RHOB|nr:haloalkane dehalogenase [Actibacterium mucosum]KAJ57039.1 hypothetical protein ACMU_00680 [Actibacterium mucosum KCTC 23349]
MANLLKLAVLALAALPLSVQAEAPAHKLPLPVISEEQSLTVKMIPVLDSEIAYVESGTGAPVLFIHGNPTSSYLWRNVLPYAAETGRAIAFDLIGMGNSGKPDIDHSYADHYAYVEGFVEAMELTDITLVIHDWGAALGWDFARQNPDKVKRIAFMEGVLPPSFPIPSFDAMGDVGQAMKAMRDPVQGHEMVIKNNMFVEVVLPGFVNRPLGAAAVEAYGAPFADEASRTPTLEWPRQLPIEGAPAQMVTLMENLHDFMTTTDMPTLLIYAEPGVLVPPQAVGWYTSNMQNVETAFAGQGFHFFQEDQPDAIGRALKDWMRRN